MMLCFPDEDGATRWTRPEQGTTTTKQARWQSSGFYRGQKYRKMCEAGKALCVCVCAEIGYRRRKLRETGRSTCFTLLCVICVHSNVGHGTCRLVGPLDWRNQLSARLVLIHADVQGGTSL
jgi:hypothetical protein